MAKPTPQQVTRNRLIALAIVAVIGIWFLTSHHGGGGAKYQATVTGYNVVNPADLSVTVKVTNTGTAAGTPTCTIDAQDASYAYHGVDVVTLQKPVPAGVFNFFSDDLTITSQGAEYVTQVTAKCS
jgi:hypothetical protein